MFTHARGADMSLRDVTIAQMGLESANDVTHWTRRVDFWGSLKRDEFACYGRRTRWGADGKVIIERFCISLPYVETFNSKVIKGFVPELRISCFWIPMFYVYMLWTFYVRFAYPYLAVVQSVAPVIVAGAINTFVKDNRILLKKLRNNYMKKCKHKYTINTIP